MSTKLTPEEADTELTRRLRREAELEWMRRYTIEQAAIIVEDAALLFEPGARKDYTREEMSRRAMNAANAVRALKNKPLDASARHALRTVKP